LKLDAPSLFAAEGFVLAGGESRRMGRDKALAEVAGHTLVELSLQKLRDLPLAEPASVRIAGARSGLDRFATVVPDLHPGCGPLSGIEAALSAAIQPLAVFLPVDLPLVPSGFLRCLLERAVLSGALATYLRVAGREQPLCAIYHRDLLPFFTQAILRDEWKVTRAVRTAVRELGGGSPAERLDVFDLELLLSANPELYGVSKAPWHLWFSNCNRPGDLAFVRDMFARGYLESRGEAEPQLD
jgi:molybdopterin-guanine dinucleotide biosynthesis protein A